jgi:DNA-binding winged helix-turn-helix (wHTH) protein
MKKAQVRSVGSLLISNPARVVSKDQLNAVTGGDGVVNTKLPQKSDA